MMANVGLSLQASLLLPFLHYYYCYYTDTEIHSGTSGSRVGEGRRERRRGQPITVKGGGRQRREKEEGIGGRVGVSLCPRRGMEGERGSQMYRRQRGRQEEKWKEIMKQLHEKNRERERA